MGVRRCKKMDLKRIAKATGGHLVVTLANMEGEESFDPSFLGHAEEVRNELNCAFLFSDYSCITFFNCLTRNFF